jgi:hypothetical protein
MNPSRGELLYSARFPKALLVFRLVGIGIMIAMLLGGFGLFAALGLVASDSAAMVAGVVVVAMVGLLIVAICGVSGWRGARLAMNVTTLGIEVRGFLRDHWIPWPQVAVIEQSTHWYWRRAACVVTTGGQRIIAIATSYQYLYLRGEPHDATARDPHIPQLPTRVAIDVHRRWLSGEFGRRV